MTLVSWEAGVGVQGEGVCGYEVVAERERRSVGLTEGNYCLTETGALTNHSQVMEERSKNFRNFPEAQVLITGLGSSGMLPDGNQQSDF